MIRKERINDEYELKQISVRMVANAPLMSNSPIKRPEDAVKLIGDEMRSLDREYICVINMDSLGRPINYEFCGIGTAGACLISPQSIFKGSVLSNATSFILMHNHPGGSAEPSQEDIDVTSMMVRAGRIMQIPMRDHIIVPGDANARLYSFNENGMMEMYSNTFIEIESTDPWDRVGEPKATYGNVNAKIEEITQRLEAGIRELFDSDKYKQYLNIMARFHSYSPTNSLLIMLQRPDATQVAGYRSWKTNFGRQVNSGEKAITIIAPMQCRREKEVDKYNDDGTVVKEKKLIEYTRYKTSCVFDVSQTTGKELPQIVHQLTDNVDGFKKNMEILKGVSPVPISIEKMDSEANGYFSLNEKRIVVKDGLSEEQTIKTTIHEVAHSILHDKDNGLDKDADRSTRELEAESVAFIVASYIGLDTSEYSFGYICGWSPDKDLKQFKESLEVIQSTSASIIKQIEQVMLIDENTEYQSMQHVKSRHV